MKNLYKIALFVIVAFYWSNNALWAMTSNENNHEKNYFQFTISHYHTSRQSGQVVNIYARYAYPKELPSNQYVDYRKIRSTILRYMEPSNDFPADVFWEILATHIGNELMKEFPLAGISVQLEVLDNPNPDTYEPGDHGPIFTIGDIAPLDVHH